MGIGQFMRRISISDSRSRKHFRQNIENSGSTITD